jgi:GntR family transcriptional regulator, N-acetylglucosamine utilization regulator
MVVRQSPVPLYIQIDEELRGLIEGGDLGPLAQVPSETDLADRFGVSRMTARKALDRLVADGMLFRQPGKGTFVAPTKIAHGASQGLSFSEAMRAQGRRSTTRVLEADVITAPSNVARALSLPSGSRAIFLRRLRLVDEEPAAIHLSYLPSRLSAILESDLTGSLSDLLSRVGARVQRSEDTVEAVLATGEEAGLLAVPRGSPLVLIRGTAFSVNNEPIRYTEALYPGGRWRFSLAVSQEADLRPELKEAR